MPQRRARVRRLGRTLALPLIAAGTTLAAWAFWWEPASLRVRDYALAIETWPAECSGLRIAVLADLHVGSPHHGIDQLRRIVDRTLETRPDVVLLAGDYVIDSVRGGRFVEPESIAAELRRLTAPLGVFGVLGNHDWWLDGPRIEATLEAAGVTMLENRARPIERDACRFWVAGIGDFGERKDDVDRTLAAVPAGDGPILALTHNPDIFPELPPGIDLVIAGHTHGGQVRWPLFGRPVVPSRYGERYAAGVRREAGRLLFVSTGLGTSILPVRFRVPPEISLLELRAPA